MKPWLTQLCLQNFSRIQFLYSLPQILHCNVSSSTWIYICDVEWDCWSWQWRHWASREKNEHAFEIIVSLEMTRDLILTLPDYCQCYHFTANKIELTFYFSQTSDSMISCPLFSCVNFWFPCTLTRDGWAFYVPAKFFQHSTVQIMQSLCNVFFYDMGVFHSLLSVFFLQFCTVLT